MRKFYIGFSKNRQDAPFSVLLQKYMGKDYSHVYAKYMTKRYMGEDSVYHSSLTGGVSFMSEPKFLEKNEEVRVYEIELDDVVYVSIRKALFSECGESYAIWQNVGIALVDMLRFVGINYKNPFTKGQNCSELIFRYVISELFEEYIDIYDPETVRPDDIEDILIEKGYVSSI